MTILERSRGVLVAAGLLMIGCDGPEKLSSAPEGITIYEHKDYLGKSLTLNKDQRNLKDIEGPCLTSGVGGGIPSSITFLDTWDDCISSIRVSPGWRGTAYDRDDFSGVSVTLTKDIPSLERVPGRNGGNMNDEISSIRVSRQ